MGEGGRREKQPGSILSLEKCARACTLLQMQKGGKLRKKSNMQLEEDVRDEGWRRGRERRHHQERGGKWLRCERESEAGVDLIPVSTDGQNGSKEKNRFQLQLDLQKGHEICPKSKEQW